MSNALPYARPAEDGRTDRLNDQLDMWKQMGTYAEKVRADAAILSGDLFDKAKTDPITLVETVRAIAELSRIVEVWILPGNHDAATIRGERFNVELFDAYGARIRYLRTGVPVSVEAGRLMFWPLEYMPVAETLVRLKELRQAARKYPDAGHILLFHNSVIGCAHLSWICDDGIPADVLTKGWDWVIGGHFHTHQRFGPKLNGMYCGAPMQHDFGDVGEERGFWDIVWTGSERDTLTRKDILVPVSAPRFWKADPGAVPPEARAGDYIRWDIEATQSDFLAVRSELEAMKQSVIDLGFKVDFKHRPIHHHKHRIVDPASDDMSKITINDMIRRYAKSKDIDVGQLSRKRLATLGTDILEEAQREAPESGMRGATSTSISIEGVEATDFCCFEHVSVPLSKRGLVFIVGDHRDSAAASSNGTGKSTLFKAVSWGFFGETVDDMTGDAVIRLGTKVASVILTLVDGANRWIITRTRSKGKPGLQIQHDDGSGLRLLKEDKKQLQRRIETLLGTDFRAFKNTVLYGQNDVSKFADPRTSRADRYEMVHTILRTEGFADCYEVTKRRRKVIADEAATLDQDIRLTEREMDAVKSEIEASHERETAWEANRKKRVKDIEAKARAAVEEAKAVKDGAPDVATVEVQIAAEEAEQAALLKKAKDVDWVDGVMEDVDKRARKLDAERNGVIAEGKALRAQRERLDVDMCPVCTSPMTSGAPAALKLDIDGRLEALRARARDLKAKALLVEAEREPLLKRRKAAREAQSKANLITDSLHALRRKLARAQSASADSDALVARAKEMVREARQVRDEANPHAAGSDAARVKLGTLRDKRDGFAERRASLDENLGYLNFWVRGFAPQGLPSFVLDGVMPFLTERANHYLETLADSDITVNISTQRELKSKKGEHTDEITIEWDVEGNEGVQKSGGQQTKVNLAVDFALMDLATTREGAELDLLMVDEALDGLDKEGTARVLSLLQKLRSRRGSIFVISHTEDMSEVFEHGITVVREGGVSRIEVAR